MADAGRFLGVDHAVTRTAADVASPPRSTSDYAGLAYPLTKQQLDAGKRGYTAGRAAVIDRITTAAGVYRENGLTDSASAIENLIAMEAERPDHLDFDAAMLDPRR